MAVLNWKQRYSVACDIAAALVHLHEDCEQRVLHRDIKSSNVMLDSNFSAKLGDFGLARLVERDQAPSHTTAPAGTFGYLASECVNIGKASVESDVFSFGAVSLEIVCGRHILNQNLGERLVEWVWDFYGRGRLFDCADQKLHRNFEAKELKRLLLLGRLCSHPDPRARPKMREALKILNSEAQLSNVPLKMPVAGYDYSSSVMPTGYGASLTSTSSSVTGTSVSSSSAMHASFPSSSKGSPTEFISKPPLQHAEDHVGGAVKRSRTEFKPV